MLVVSKVKFVHVIKIRNGHTTFGAASAINLNQIKNSTSVRYTSRIRTTQYIPLKETD
jgi:hypothetical protein